MLACITPLARKEPRRRRFGLVQQGRKHIGVSFHSKHLALLSRNQEKLCRQFSYLHRAKSLLCALQSPLEHACDLSWTRCMGDCAKGTDRCASWRTDLSVRGGLPKLKIVLCVGWRPNWASYVETGKVIRKCIKAPVEHSVLKVKPLLEIRAELSFYEYFKQNTVNVWLPTLSKFITSYQEAGMNDHNELRKPHFFWRKKLMLVEINHKGYIRVLRLSEIFF